MRHTQGDTIAAPASSVSGGVAVIRISGPRAKEILCGAFAPYGGKAMPPREMRLGGVYDGGEFADEAMAVFFPAPKTYTREDVAEIHCHGGEACVARVMGILVRLGARVAGPGEFTRRAFMSGRIGLAEAEAVLAAVSARTAEQARAAARSLRGGASAFVARHREGLAELISRIEASIDFPDEAGGEASPGPIAARAREIARGLGEASGPRAARVIGGGLRVAIVGKPNAGKSSLMNALVGFDRSIVSDEPGTTRDSVSETVEYMGAAIRLSDTAGLRDALQDGARGDRREPSANPPLPSPIEAQGVARARAIAAESDAVLWVVDGSIAADGRDARFLAGADDRHVAVISKCDLPTAMRMDLAPLKSVRVSARTGEGVEGVLSILRDMSGGESAFDLPLANARHMGIAGEAARLIASAADGIESGEPLEAAAPYLWDALNLLGEITGESASEAVLDGIFSAFCVGK